MLTIGAIPVLCHFQAAKKKVSKKKAGKKAPAGSDDGGGGDGMEIDACAGLSPGKHRKPTKKLAKKAGGGVLKARYIVACGHWLIYAADQSISNA